jgi:uncharacterized protein
MQVTHLERTLAWSSDRSNPGMQEIVDLLHRVKRIAVVGMSRDPEKPARRIPAYLAVAGYEVIPVNPNATRIIGKDVYASLAEVPGELDLVVMFRPSDQVGPFVDEAAGRPERPAIWLQEGITAEEEVKRARDSGLVVVQDLCIYKVHRLL